MGMDMGRAGMDMGAAGMGAAGMGAAGFHAMMQDVARGEEFEDGMGMPMMGSSLSRQQSAAVPISGSMRIAGGAMPMRRTAESALPAFRPPHEIAAESYGNHHALPSSVVANSSRHKSIADRLKAVVFEQSGFTPMATAHGFLA
jgi:hypothetical protein